jgi:hypothetical protein
VNSIEDVERIDMEARAQAFAACAGRGIVQSVHSG